jgi:hypothetical protein
MRERVLLLKIFRLQRLLLRLLRGRNTMEAIIVVCS